MDDLTVNQTIFCVSFIIVLFLIGIFIINNNYDGSSDILPTSGVSAGEINSRIECARYELNCCVDVSYSLDCSRYKVSCGFKC